MGRTITDEQPKIHYDCSKCPAFCCSIYERVQVTKRDLNRLAKYFGVAVEVAEKRYTKMHSGERVLRRKRDLNRLAKYFGVPVETAEKRYTKMHSGERVLRRKKDPIFGQACQFLNPETRGCGIYHARPAVCREYPDRSRCAYYDLLQFERRQQDDENALPLVQITFREVKKKEVNGKHGSEEILEWEDQ